MPIFKIHHITKYEYDRPVKESVNNIMIFPFQSDDQETLSHELFITDKPEVFSYNDYWGNKAGTFNLVSPHKELVIESKLLIRTLVPEPLQLPKDTYQKDIAKYVDNDVHLLELARVSDVKDIALMQEYVTGLFHLYQRHYHH